jgi:hypothetical protein
MLCSFGCFIIQRLYNTERDDRIITNEDFGGNREEVIVAYFMVLPLHSSRVPERNHKKPQSGHPTTILTG